MGNIRLTPKPLPAPFWRTRSGSRLTAPQPYHDYFIVGVKTAPGEQRFIVILHCSHKVRANLPIRSFFVVRPCQKGLAPQDKRVICPLKPSKQHLSVPPRSES